MPVSQANAIVLRGTGNWDVLQLSAALPDMPAAESDSDLTLRRLIPTFLSWFMRERQLRLPVLAHPRRRYCEYTARVYEVLLQWLQEQPGMRDIVLPMYLTRLRSAPSSARRASWYLQQLRRTVRRQRHLPVADEEQPGSERALAVLRRDGCCALYVRLVGQVQMKPHVLPVDWPQLEQQLMHDGVIKAVRRGKASRRAEVWVLRSGWWQEQMTPKGKKTEVQA